MQTRLSEVWLTFRKCSFTRLRRLFGTKNTGSRRAERHEGITVAKRAVLTTSAATPRIVGSEARTSYSELDTIRPAKYARTCELLDTQGRVRRTMVVHVTILSWEPKAFFIQYQDLLRGPVQRTILENISHFLVVQNRMPWLYSRCLVSILGCGIWRSPGRSCASTSGSHPGTGTGALHFCRCLHPTTSIGVFGRLTENGVHR